MSIYNWPYSNFHELNLDWILQELKNLRAAIPEYEASYTDAVYVQKYIDMGMSFDDAFSSALSDANPHSTIILPAKTYTMTRPIYIYKPCRITSTYTGWVYAESNQYQTVEDGRKTNIVCTADNCIIVKASGVEIDHIAIYGRSGAFVGILASADGVGSNTGIIRFLHIHDIGMYAENGLTCVSCGDTILSTIKNVYCYGFVNGFEVRKISQNSTSLIFENCWAQGYSGVAYLFDSLYYSTLISCAADSNRNGQTAYSMTNCKNVNFIGCGAEYAADVAMKLIDSQNITINLFTLSVSGPAAVSLTNSQNILLQNSVLDNDTKIILDSASTFVDIGSGVNKINRNGVVEIISNRNNIYFKPTTKYTPTINPTGGSTELIDAEYFSEAGICFVTVQLTLRNNVQSFTVNLPSSPVTFVNTQCIGLTNGDGDLLASGLVNVTPLNGNSFSDGRYSITIIYKEYQ